MRCFTSGAETLLNIAFGVVQAIKHCIWGCPSNSTTAEALLLQVLAANKEVEEANERRKKESESLKPPSSDAYSKAAKKNSFEAKKGSLRGISYSPMEINSLPSNVSYEVADASESDASEVPSAPKFNFEEPPTTSQPPKRAPFNAPSDPSSDPNAFSTVPLPSALAPAQPEQQIEGTSTHSESPFSGLFDSSKTSTNLQAVPEAPVQKAKVWLSVFLSVTAIAMYWVDVHCKLAWRCSRRLAAHFDVHHLLTKLLCYCTQVCLQGILVGTMSSDITARHCQRLREEHEQHHLLCGLPQFHWL